MDFAPVLADAAKELSRGLAYYYPSDGPNEIPEAHTLGAVGRAFAHAGFHVFHQVCCRQDGRVGHVDLVVMDEERSVCVAIEGKRLYDGRGAHSVLVDWRRLARVTLASEHRRPLLSHNFRMLLATTWQANIARWWRIGDAGRRRHAAFSDLHHELEGAVRHEHELQSTGGLTQLLLCAVAPRAAPFIIATH